MRHDSVFYRRRAAVWRASRLLLMTTAVPALGGCSFLFVSGPPDEPERVPAQAELDCSTSKAAPIVDTSIAALQVARIGLAATASESDYRDAPISREADVGIGAGMLALFGASAIYGYVTTGQCKEAKAKHDQRWGLDAPSDQVLPPPQPTRSASPPAAARTCAPNTKQACVGPDGCQGEQGCSVFGLWLLCECTSQHSDEPSVEPDAGTNPESGSSTEDAGINPEGGSPTEAQQ